MPVKAIVAAMLLISASVSHAARDYKCTVLEAKQLDDSGLLKELGWSSSLIGHEFVVEGATGKIIGGPGFSNHNGKFGQPQVIDRGSPEQAFKALTLFKPYVAVAYIQIEEYREVKEKPFLLLSNSVNIINGTCVHFGEQPPSLK